MSTQDLLDKIEKLTPLIGNTPLLELPYGDNTLLHKIEAFNSWRSAKDRPAYTIVREAIISGEINAGSTIVESSSGNFAISLGGICKFLGLKFIAVIDPNINEMNENLLNLICSEVVKVTRRDATGGFLLTRLEKVHELCDAIPDSFWPNQYANVNNPRAYYHGMGDELLSVLPSVDRAFVAVSSGGALKGLSARLKKENPAIIVHAVDVEGSVIFTDLPKSRKFSGLGSSMRPAHLNGARIDEITIVTEDEIVLGCKELLSEFALFCGASSGAIMAAVRKELAARHIVNERILCILPDSGITYLDSVYKNILPSPTLAS